MPNRSAVTGTAVAGLFFGVTLGIIGGTFVLAPNVFDTSRAANLVADQNQPGHAKKSLAQQLADKEELVKINEAQARSADEILNLVAADAVKDRLAGQSVALIRTADADEEDAAAVENLLVEAGATSAGKLTLTPAFFSTDTADQLTDIVTNTVPGGAHLSTGAVVPGLTMGEALHTAWFTDAVSGEPLTSSGDRTIFLTALQTGGYIEGDILTIQPAQLIVLISGDDNGVPDSFGAANLKGLAQGLGAEGGAVVLAGRINSAAATGAIGLLRQDSKAAQEVSTVDSVGHTFGRVATVLAGAMELTKTSGSYGSAASAKASAPNLEELEAMKPGEKNVTAGVTKPPAAAASPVEPRRDEEKAPLPEEK